MIPSPIQSPIDRVRAYLIAELCNDALTPTRELAEWYEDGLQLADSIALEETEGLQLQTLKKKDRHNKFRSHVDLPKRRRVRGHPRFGPRNEPPPKRRA